MSSLPITVFSFIIKFAFGGYEECGYKFTESNVTFDLSPLTLTSSSSQSYYTVTTGNYEYNFNLCQDVMDEESIPNGLCGFYDYDFTDPNGVTQTRAGGYKVSALGFQYGESSGDCFRLAGSVNETEKYNISDTLITYELFDADDPALGVIINYDYGDSCVTGNRKMSIKFVCDRNMANITDSGEEVTESPTCQYNIEIKSIYGCPLECGRGLDGTLCSNNGGCGYDFDEGRARCYCFAGHDGEACDQEAPFYGEASWYEELQPDNESIAIEFETNYGFNVIYDLKYLIDGYISDQYYKLLTFDGSYNVYFNILQPIDLSLDDTLCINNDDSDDTGYIFQQNSSDPEAQCVSLGTMASNITLYDETEPTRGIKVSFTNGETEYYGSYWWSECSDGLTATINFICPDSNRYEQYDSMYGLNQEFMNYTFSEILECNREVEIFTSAACPFQCITYDEDRDSLSQCTANGICAFDSALDVTRCICDDNVNVTSREDIFCENPDITYTPSASPTDRPTLPPIISYYENVTVPSSHDIVFFETVYGYNISYNFKYIENAFEIFNGFTFMKDSAEYYVNFLDKTGGCDDVSDSWITQTTGDDCYSLGRNITYGGLYNKVYPAQGLTFAFDGGDECFGTPRKSEINFLCPDDGGMFERQPLKLESYDINEPETCEYIIDIYTSAACPVQCIVEDTENDIISVCQTNGICEYDDSFGLVKCDCFGNAPIESMDDIKCPNVNLTYPPSEDPTPSPTDPPFVINFYRQNVPDSSSPYVFTFTSDNGYNVSYDLTYLVNGYLEGTNYIFTDSDGTHNFYVNLFDKTIGEDAVIGICEGNPPIYDYGYIFQTNAADASRRCNSLGRERNIELYDTSDPLAGIKISFEEGDGYECGGTQRRSDIYFLCDVDSDQYEFYDELNGLNEVFASKYTFTEPNTCQYEITITTAAACPYQCAYYSEDDTKGTSISVCSTEGQCIIDTQYDLTRCDCDDDTIIYDSEEDLYCADGVTFPPTNQPTSVPSGSPTADPTETGIPSAAPTGKPSATPSARPTEKYGLDGEWDFYNTNDGISLEMKIHVDYNCEYVKFTSIIPISDSNDYWFGFGIGGEYDIVSSEEDEDADEREKMNGYALITRYNNYTFETTLVAGDRPKPQTQQNLYDCSMIIDNDNNIQTTICYRELFDGDDEDFDGFKPGDIQIAWAYGTIGSDGIINYHQGNAEADDRDKIFFEGEIECKSTTTSMAASQTKDQFGADDDGDDDDNNIWMIIAIIFIVLCVILLIVSAIIYRRGQNKAPGYIHGNQLSTDAGAGGTSGQTQLTEIEDDTGTRQGDVVAADKPEKETYDENDDLL